MYNSSDSEESDDESDSSDGLEVIEEMSTGKAQGATSKETNANPNITVGSSLTVLKAPKQERKVAADRPTGKGKCKSNATNKGLTSIKPLQRNKEFPNKILVASNGKLFCKSCRKEISLKKSVIKGHIGSTKHSIGKLNVLAKEKHERDIAEALSKYNHEFHLVGETLPIEQQTYQIKIVQIFTYKFLINCCIPNSHVHMVATYKISLAQFH